MGVQFDENIAFLGRDKSGDHSGNAAVNIIIPTDELSDKIDNKTNESFTAVGDKTSEAFREIPLDKNSHIAKLIARLDEESHRFAITYHQNLRAKAETKSALDGILGVGPVTRKKLLKHFGSVTKLRDSSEAEIAQVVGQKMAQNIKRHL